MKGSKEEMYPDQHVLMELGSLDSVWRKTDDKENMDITVKKRCKKQKKK